MAYDNLFKPITLRGVRFPNRIQRTSMVSGLSTEDGFVTDEIKRRYQREAKGGVGAIVVEAAVVIASKSPFNLRISDDRFVSGDARAGDHRKHLVRVKRGRLALALEERSPGIGIGRDMQPGSGGKGQGSGGQHGARGASGDQEFTSFHSSRISV